jgi:hypothetical protein
MITPARERTLPVEPVFRRRVAGATAIAAVLGLILVPAAAAQDGARTAAQPQTEMTAGEVAAQLRDLRS